MSCWEIELELGGRNYTVPALSAVDWWPIVTNPETLLDVLDLIEGGQEELDDRLLAGEVTLAEIWEALRDAVEAAAGRSLHAAYVIASTAEQGWSRVNGTMVAKGFRWDGAPLGAALDAVYATVLGLFQKQEDLDGWLRLLNDEALTTPGKKREASATVKNEFESMAGPRPTGGARSTVARSGSARSKTRTRPRPPRQDGPSGAPMPPPSPPAGSDPPASHAGPEDADGPASGIGPRPPQPAR